MKPQRCAALLLLASTLAVGPVSAQVTVGVPGSGQGTTFPFGQGAGYTQFQEFLSASYFVSPFTANSVTFYRTTNNTGNFQQGTFSLYLNTTTTTLDNYDFGNPGANETSANRTLIGTVIIPNASTTAPTLTFSGLGMFNYDPSMGNLLIDVDFTPIGALFAFNRATFDTFSDPVGNQSDLVATGSSINSVLGGTASSRGQGLVATFGVVAPTVVPEPSTVVLMSAGLAAMLLAARRKKAV